jgi:hypothetical protein
MDLLHIKHVQGFTKDTVHTTYFKINLKLTDIRKRYSNLCAADSVEQCCGSGFTESESGYRSGPAFQVK